MNAVRNELKSAALLLVFLASSTLARAWYDPGVQRWINRDPLGDQGVVDMLNPDPSYYEASTSRPGIIPFVPIVERSQGPNLYTFLANKPGNAIDPLGTISIRAIPFPCPSEFILYCGVACAQQNMVPAPKCGFSRIGGHWYIVLDCGCWICPWNPW